MSYQAVVYDLDGTLLDSLADIATAANTVLEQHGFPTYPLSRYQHLVGEGVMRLFENALPAEMATEAVLASCAEDFRAVYALHWNINTQPYEGIVPLLAELTRRGIRQAVLSNKPHEFTKRCVAQYLSDYPLAPVFGQRAGVPRKPDPTAAMEIIAQLGVPAERFAYVGDTGIDMATARAAGMYAVGVLWGFRDRDELIAAGAQRLVAHPAELLELFPAETGRA